MLAMAPYGKIALVALGILLRWVVAKLDFFQKGSGVGVTGGTGNVTVITDKLFRNYRFRLPSRSTVPANLRR